MAVNADWYCLRARPKQEHIAAAHLQTIESIEVFLPRVRFKRATRQGPAWVTEALFPNYLFARFDWQSNLRQVQAARGVAGVVHFGDRWPVIPNDIIQELQAVVGATGLHTVSDGLSAGDSVKIVNGAMHGLTAVVSRVMPGRQRVAILMDFLGRPTEIQMSVNSLLKEGSSRALVVPAPKSSP